jgi:hypothetical protein
LPGPLRFFSWLLFWFGQNGQSISPTALSHQ